jgi:hypothetical protein
MPRRWEEPGCRQASTDLGYWDLHQAALGQHWRSTGCTTGDALGTTLGMHLGPALANTRAALEQALEMHFGTPLTAQPGALVSAGSLLATSPVQPWAMSLTAAR